MSSEQFEAAVRKMSGISSAHFLKLVEDRGTIGFWSSDIATGQGSATLGLLRLLGLENGAQFRIADFSRFIHPDDRGYGEDIWTTIRQGIPVNRNFRIIRSDRTVRWVEFKSEVVLDAQQKPFKAIGLIIDVTDQQEGRQALEDALDRYRALVGSLATMEWRSSADGHPIFSHGWTALTGQVEMDAANNGWLQTIHPDDRELVSRKWQESVSTLAPYALNHRILLINGHYEWFHARAVPIIKRGGRSHEWLGIIMRQADLKREAPMAPPSMNMLTPIQVRAARAMLQWTLDELSQVSGVSVSSIRRIEGEGERATRPASLHAIRTAFEEYGIQFAVNSAGAVTVTFLGQK
ncbi:PAS domain-containing protein [Rhizobium sp. SL42]|uniref:PAS domain-containing protein n=1 Tax=Rhizobium sp. SL42 TaxID=2806346 RepID=UPI001F3C35C8|nr:PAS domain-containing protein [Rhizobium sp. SL42]